MTSVTVTLCGNVSYWANKVGELSKAVHKHENAHIRTTSVTGTVNEKLADALIYLCAIANRLGISIGDTSRKGRH